MSKPNKPNPKHSQQDRVHEQPSSLKCVYALEGSEKCGWGNIFKIQGIIEFPGRFLIKRGEKKKYLSNDYAATLLPDVRCHRDAVPRGCRATGMPCQHIAFCDTGGAALALVLPDTGCGGPGAAPCRAAQPRGLCHRNQGKKAIQRAKHFQ